jgi:ribosomal protein S18 acetylase RimI-like enzyme
MRRLLERIEPPTGYATLREPSGQVVAVGLGVCDDGYTGLFDIVTDANFRRRGFGLALVTSLLAWGTAHGAHSAYLQVMADNHAALSLYQRFGFREAYPYWYRVAPR